MQSCTTTKIKKRNPNWCHHSLITQLSFKLFYNLPHAKWSSSKSHYGKVFFFMCIPLYWPRVILLISLKSNLFYSIPELSKPAVKQNVSLLRSLSVMSCHLFLLDINPARTLLPVSILFLLYFQATQLASSRSRGLQSRSGHSFDSFGQSILPCKQENQVQFPAMQIVFGCVSI